MSGRIARCFVCDCWSSGCRFQSVVYGERQPMACRGHTGCGRSMLLHPRHSGILPSMEGGAAAGQGRLRRACHHRHSNQQHGCDQKGGVNSSKKIQCSSPCLDFEGVKRAEAHSTSPLIRRSRLLTVTPERSGVPDRSRRSRHCACRASRTRSRVPWRCVPLRHSAPPTLRTAGCDRAEQRRWPRPCGR